MPRVPKPTHTRQELPRSPTSAIPFLPDRRLPTQTTRDPYLQTLEYEGEAAPIGCGLWGRTDHRVGSSTWKCEQHGRNTRTHHGWMEVCSQSARAYLPPDIQEGHHGATTRYSASHHASPPAGRSCVLGRYTCALPQSQPSILNDQSIRLSFKVEQRPDHPAIETKSVSGIGSNADRTG